MNSLPAPGHFHPHEGATPEISVQIGKRHAHPPHHDGKECAGNSKDSQANEQFHRIPFGVRGSGNTFASVQILKLLIGAFLGAGITLWIDTVYNRHLFKIV